MLNCEHCKKNCGKTVKYQNKIFVVMFALKNIKKTISQKCVNSADDKKT